MNLISKKDLLAQTGISYGQLYRWKRQRLIPDEWFIKQASYTGQETFFPREQILSRVQSILELKDKHSMEELARMFSPETAGMLIPAGKVQTLQEIDSELLALLDGNKENYAFAEAVLLAILSQAVRETEIPVQEAAGLFRKGAAALYSRKTAGLACVVFRADGSYYIAFTKGFVLFGGDVATLGVWPMDEWAGKLKISDQGKWKQGEKI